MYDTSFDNSESRSADQAVLWGFRIAALAATIAAASADAQLPGAPLLQNGWATPGMVGAVNVAGGPGGTVYAGALSWTPAAGRVQVIGGAGIQSGPGLGSGGAYGLRVAAPLGGMSSAFGFAAFAGVGGGGTRTRTVSVPCASAPQRPAACAGVTDPNVVVAVDSTSSSVEVPVGAAIGWRRPIGNTRGISFYATPSYVFLSGGTRTGGLLRAGIGADVGITGSMGVTAGIELGATRPRALGGPSGTLFGVGLSYAFGRR